MAQTNLALVTGANGHLGNNLVRLLIEKGIPVRASVRNLAQKEPFADLPCEVVQADITNKPSLVNALRGVDTFYAVGAAFKLWAKDPKKEIYDTNLVGTQLMVEAAAEAGVRRIVYVSSIAALNYTQLPTRESNGYNPDRRDMYYNSKNDGEQLAFELARKHGLELVSVLPSAMIGREAFAPLSVSYNILKLILNKEVPVETNITLNWIDVRDVAEGCYLAATKGRSGERYILANEQCTSIKETTQLAQTLHPDLKISLPVALPKPLLYGIAGLMELASRFTGKAPLLSVKDVAMFSGLQQNFDISKAREELGFNPKPPARALKEAMAYLRERGLITAKSVLMLLLTLVALAGQAQVPPRSPKLYVSLETDPAFWAGTLPNGPGFDANINFRLPRQPRLRLGVLGYTGTWGGSLGKSLLLTRDFPETDWEIQWNGLGLEAQYQFRFGLARGGLQPGLRMQWNQFRYHRGGQRQGEANHFVLTPQLGFQWFPFKKSGFYVLPWAGVQLPALGTDRLLINQELRETRRLMPIVTAHIGWEFTLR